MVAKEKTKNNPLKLSEMKGFKVKYGITGKEIAKKMNKTPQSYYFKESGANFFTIEDLIMFIKIVDLNLEEIVELFKDNILRQKLLEYQKKTVLETRKSDIEKFKKLLKKNHIKVKEDLFLLM